MRQPSLTIKDMQKIAKNRGGRCLSENYEGQIVHLLWECSEGHIWEAIPRNIKRGHWCSTCAGKLNPLH